MMIPCSRDSVRFVVWVLRFVWGRLVALAREVVWIKEQKFLHFIQRSVENFW